MDWRDREWKLLIGGEWVAGGNGTSPIINPATEQIEAHAPEASVAVKLAERFVRYGRDATKALRIGLPPSSTAATPLAPGGLIGGVVQRRPAGVVACISPHNFPLTNQAGKITPALAVGCTVVMKPAPQDPLAVLVLAEVLDEVGFPPGVVDVITSSAAEGAELVVDGRNPVQLERGFYVAPTRSPDVGPP